VAWRLTPDRAELRSQRTAGADRQADPARAAARCAGWGRAL